MIWTFSRFKQGIRYIGRRLAPSVWLIWLLIYTNSSVKADELTGWPLIKNSFYPVMNVSGDRVAFRVLYGIQVWQVNTEGNLSGLVWDSRGKLHNSVFYGYAWIGNDLALSRISHVNQQVRIEDLSDGELHLLEKGRGDTVLLDLDTGRASRGCYELHGLQSEASINMTKERICSPRTVSGRRS
jgi:hypothetical protein